MSEEIWSLVSFFCGVSLFAFGGGNAALANIRTHALASGWVTQQQFLHVYSLGQVAPGPSAMYVAGIGYAVAGVPGAVAAGLAFVVPAAVLVTVANRFWLRWGDDGAKEVLRRGLAPVTVALLAAGAFHLFKSMGAMVADVELQVVAAWSVVLLMVGVVTALSIRGRVSPVLLVLGSGLVGLIVLR